MKGYLTVDGEFINKITIDRSDFICRVKGIESEEQAKDYINSVRKKESLATHNCYCYIADDIGLIQKFSDDGEPQGTAGMPMLNVLKNKKLYKTVAVVTRYFGGIKLGAGGLVRAYGSAVIECLKNAKILDVKSAVFVDISLEYDGYSNLLRFLEGQKCKIISTDFLDKIKISLAVEEENENSFFNFHRALNDFFNGKITAEKVKQGFFAF